MFVRHIVPSLEDRHGGPSRSVRALAAAQAAQGDRVDLLATREGQEPLAPGHAGTARELIFARQRPLSLCRSSGLATELLATSADLLHNHALWLLPLRYATAAARQYDRPLVLSPRGMLSGWAHRHRRWRKWLAAHLVHPGAFATAAGWHATSAAEAADIRALGFKQPICVAPNGVDLPDSAALAAARTAWVGLCPALASRPVALFYSRFHRKKRLRELIDLWFSAPRGDWFLLIAGVPEEYTVPEIQDWIARAGGRDRAAVFDGRGLPPPYAAAQLFLLPTHSENFGLVVAEALAAGLPALVTDGAPWAELADRGAGWCGPWPDYGPALATWLAQPASALVAQGRQGRTWMERDYSWTGAARILGSFYRELAHAAP